MRILRLDSWDGRSGGGQEYVRSVADELAARGHPQRLLSLTSEAGYVARTDERVFRVAAGGARRATDDLLEDPRFRDWVDAEVAAFRPDIVHLHHFEAEFTSIARFVARSTVPVVATAHDAAWVCPISTLVLPSGEICEGGVLPRCGFTGCRVGFGLAYNLVQTRTFDREVAPRIRVFLSPSARLVPYLESQGYRPALHLPPFAVIPPEVRSAPYAWPALAPVLRFGYIGRLEAYKGVFDLVEALPLLRERFPTLRLSVAGEGPARTEMEQRADRLGVAAMIEWAGHRAGPDKEEWFRSVVALVVPSNAWENFGLVALEALTRGRPVVATEFGGLPDVVQDRESGRLVPLGRPRELAEGILDLLSDLDRARAWAEEGRRRALARFTPELHVERLLAVYERVVTGQTFESGTPAARLVEGARST